MTRYIATRLLLMLPTLLGVLIATFILIQFVPKPRRLRESSSSNCKS